VRNLTKTLAAVSLLVPASAYPLGIGDIKLHSALNQRLDAEIALLVSAGEDVSEIKVRLASPEKFDEAGVPWSYFLSKIKFKAVTQANGTTVVKLSSKEALREPFLDFLLEVTWASGNLYREFTVLVDPPATYKQSSIPVITKPQQSAAVSSSRAVIKPSKQMAVTHAVVEGTYGPVSKTDSLWKVAEKTNAYDDVSIEQMMMAIYDANPSSFYKKNVNALMAGKTLEIPAKDVILKLSRQQALAAFKQQNNEWLGRVSKQAQKTRANDAGVNAQLELEAPVEGEIADSSVVVTEDGSAIKQAVDSGMRDSLITASDEGLALQARMDKLEQQLVMMQKILILKDEEIAALQNKTSSQSVEPPVPAPKVETGEEKTIVIKTIEEQQQAKVSKPAVAKPVPAPVVKEAPAPVVKKIPKPKPKVVKPVAPAEPEDELSYLPLAGGVGVAILGVLGLLWWRKRKDEDEADTESMFASASEISLPDSSVDELSNSAEDDETSYDVGTVGESSFLSEFTPSDFDAFDTDQNEVDPISEADVYLAYGRYQQAEDLMRQAIEDYPDRDECKLKLLEIFYTNENAGSFEEYAKELIASGRSEDKAFWSKVAEMGSEIDPESSLYDGKASFDAVELEQEPQESALSNDLGDISVNDEETVNIDSSHEEEFDLSVFDDNEKLDSVDSIVEEDADKPSESNELDFDLSVFDIDGSSTEEEPENNEPESDVETIDFDLNSVAFEDSEKEEVVVEAANSLDDIESLDFDLGDESVAEDKEGDSVPVGEIDLSDEVESDVDLESFDFSADIKTEEEPVTEANVTAEGIDDFDFDFDTPISSTASPVAELDAGVSDLTDMDELETKIDLARAYIDMGDADAAKDIAEEVLEKGSDEQKSAAQDILDQL